MHTAVSTVSAVVGTVVVLVLLLALSIGVNIGVCSVLLARLFFNRKRKEKHFKGTHPLVSACLIIILIENTASIQIGNPSYHNDELSGEIYTHTVIM